jgi:hypothetical protein
VVIPGQRAALNPELMNTDCIVFGSTAGDSFC